MGASSDIAPLVIDGDEWLIDISVDPRGNTACGPVSGEWLVLDDGRVSTTSPQIEVPEECPSFTLSSWLKQTHFAGLDGTLLVLLDEDGDELGRLSPVPPSPVDWSAKQMVGAWSVTYPADFVGSTIEIGAKIYTANLPCGQIQGDWAALDGAFAAIVWGGNGCPPEEDQAPWLFGATSIELDNGSWRLKDANGNLVATLIPDLEWTPSEFDNTPSPEVWADLSNPVSLPSTLTPGSIVGEWASLSSGRASTVEFSDDGTWRGTDGCNDGSGRWKALANGRLLIVAPSIMLALGCAGGLAEEWLGSARLAGFDGDELVLLDSAGNELDRLVEVQGVDR